VCILKNRICAISKHFGNAMTGYGLLPNDTQRRIAKRMRNEIQTHNNLFALKLALCQICLALRYYYGHRA
jgi:hypothetical protein